MQKRIKFEEIFSTKLTVNTIDFIDKQQWNLLNHMKMTFRSEKDSFYSIDQPFFTATIFAVRYPMFYILK
jgi:hypothetical protein